MFSGRDLVLNKEITFRYAERQFSKSWRLLQLSGDAAV